MNNFIIMYIFEYCYECCERFMWVFDVCMKVYLLVLKYLFVFEELFEIMWYLVDGFVVYLFMNFFYVILDVCFICYNVNFGWYCIF